MYNILVVDDDKEIVKAIEIYLNKEGYNIIKAYNGEEALKKLEENEIHLSHFRHNDAKKRWDRNIKRYKKRKNNTSNITYQQNLKMKTK